MKLIVLYGRPAVGKLAVARELAALTGGRLFHNHLAVNLALSVFDFGTPAFVEVRERTWLTVFRRAIADGVPLLIFTFNPENSVPQKFIDDLFAEVAAACGEVIPIELTASEATIEARLGSESRKRDAKTLDVGTYRQLLAKGAFDTPIIRETRLSLDTGEMEAADAAGRIAAVLR
jgi:hypothetical protein